MRQTQNSKKWPSYGDLTIDETGGRGVRNLLFHFTSSAVAVVTVLFTLSPQAVADDKLYEAVARGDNSVFEKFANDQSKRNYRSDIGLTSLELAHIAGYREFVEILSNGDASTEIDIPPGPVLVDRYLTNLVGEVKKHPALVVSVSKDGEVLFEKAYGYANREDEITANLNTQFRIGSMSKQFTGAAIVLLEEQGKLSITDPLDMHVPGYPNGNRITIEHLLHHSSGIPNYTDQKGFVKQVGQRISPLKIIDGFKELPLEFEPGSKYKYSNSGYVLLAHIIERVSGEGYAKFLNENIFEKLGMNSSGVYDNRNSYPDEAMGYSYSFFSYRPAKKWDMSQAYGTGNIYSTVKDLRKWVEAYFSGHVVNLANINRAIDPTNSPVGYGHGYTIWPQRGLTKIFHSGGLHGYSSFLVHYPDAGTTIAVLMAVGIPTKNEISAEQISDWIDDLFLWQQMTPRELYVIEPDINPEVYDDYTGKYSYPTTRIAFVIRRDNKLFYKVDKPGKKSIELLPMGDDEFFAMSPKMKIHFLRDSSNNVQGLKHFHEELSFEAVKMN